MPHSMEVGGLIGGVVVVFAMSNTLFVEKCISVNSFLFRFAQKENTFVIWA